METSAHASVMVYLSVCNLECWDVSAHHIKTLWEYHLLNVTNERLRITETATLFIEWKDYYMWVSTQRSVVMSWRINHSVVCLLQLVPARAGSPIEHVQQLGVQHAALPLCLQVSTNSPKLTLMNSFSQRLPSPFLSKVSKILTALSLPSSSV